MILHLLRMMALFGVNSKSKWIKCKIIFHMIPPKGFPSLVSRFEKTHTLHISSFIHYFIPLKGKYRVGHKFAEGSI